MVLQTYRHTDGHSFLYCSLVKDIITWAWSEGEERGSRDSSTRGHIRHHLYFKSWKKLINPRYRRCWVHLIKVEKKNSFLLLIPSKSGPRAGVTSSGQHLNSVNSQPQPLFSGPSAGETLSGQHPNSVLRQHPSLLASDGLGVLKCPMDMCFFIATIKI